MARSSKNNKNDKEMTVMDHREEDGIFLANPNVYRVNNISMMLEMSSLVIVGSTTSFTI